MKLVTIVLLSVAASQVQELAPQLSDFKLRPATNQADLMDRVTKLDAELPKLGVANILSQASRQGKTSNGICNSKAADSEVGISYSFCWDDADSASGSKNVEWTPQGVTTVADAQADKLWNGVQPILVSWYNHDSPDKCTLTSHFPNGTTHTVHQACRKGSRISFINPDNGKYAHVLLVYPFINDAGNATYMSLRTEQTANGGSLHAGGITWYGNYLYVADTARGFRVFDMRYIFDLKAAGAKGDTTTKNKIGRQNGKFYAHGYRYVMPEVAAYSNIIPRPSDAASLCHNHGGSPTFSFVSLDRSGTDHLITGEFCSQPFGKSLPAGHDAGRVATWPLDGNTGKPKLLGKCAVPPHEEIACWEADVAYGLPVGNIQGVMRLDDIWYLSRSAGSNPGILYETKKQPNAATGELEIGLLHRAAIGPEDLSYWPGSDAHRSGIWTLTERNGQRMVYVRPKP